MGATYKLSVSLRIIIYFTSRAAADQSISFAPINSIYIS